MRIVEQVQQKTESKQSFQPVRQLQASVSFNDMFLTIQKNSQINIDNLADNREFFGAMEGGVDTMNTNITDNSTACASKETMKFEDVKKSDFSFNSEVKIEEKNALNSNQSTEMKEVKTDENRHNSASKNQHSQNEEQSKNAAQTAKSEVKESASETTKEKSKREVNAQSETAAQQESAEAQKKETQNLLKKIANAKNSEELEKLLAQLAALMNLSLKEMKQMLKNEGVNINEIKAALGEGDSAKAQKGLKELVFKVSDFVNKKEVADKKSENEATRVNVKTEKNSEEKTESAVKNESLIANSADKEAALKAADEKSAEAKKMVKVDTADTNIFRKETTHVQDNQQFSIDEFRKSILNDEAKTAKAKEAAKSKAAQSSAVEVKQSSEIGSNRQSQMFFAEAVVRRAALQIEGDVTSIKTKQQDPALKAAIEGIIEKSSDSKKSANQSNNSNSQNFSFNQNTSFSGKMSSLYRGEQTTQASYTNTEFKQNLEQMIKSIKIIADQGVNQIEMKLQPAHLGKINIDLVMEKGTIVAKFVSENEAAKQLIESNMDQLKASLEEQGLKITGFEVSVDQNNNFADRQSQAAQNENKDNGRRNNSSNNRNDGSESLLKADEIIKRDYIDRRFSSVSYIA